MNHHNQDQSRNNNGRSEQSKASEKQAKEAPAKETLEQAESMAKSFMQGRGFRALCAAGALLMVYRMGRRVMARRARRAAR